jgi:renal tumor antigen
MLDSLLHNYALLCKIGEGSFSEVLKVKEKCSGQLFAAKRLTRSFLSIEEVEGYQELQTLLKLETHPNILNLVEYVYESEHRILTIIFNLMDFSLYDYIRDRKRKLSECRCKNFLYQLSQGLCYLHSNGIFHRDIKPENILLRIDTELQKSNPLKAELVQIGDLGSVAYTTDAMPRTEYVSTRWYRSPECLLTSGHYGPKMDVWALGCCFYEILTLQPLFPGANEIDQLDKIHSILGTPSLKVLEKFKGMSYNYEFPRKLSINWFKMVPSLSSHGVDVMKRMLIYHPDTRVSARRLLEHPYFADLKERVGHDGVSARLLFSRSAGTSASSSKRTSRTSLDSGLRINSFVKGETSKKQQFHAEMKKTLNKELERNWNKPNSGLKRSILSNITSSLKSTRRTMDRD